MTARPTLTVLFHGLGSSAEAWRSPDGYTHGSALTQALEAAGTWWIAADLYGHGRHEATEPDFDPSDISDELWPRFVEESVAAFESAIDAELTANPQLELHCVSYSGGAGILAQLLKKRPDLLPSQMVLAVPMPDRDADDEYSLHRNLEVFAKPRVTILAASADDEVDPAETSWFFDLVPEPKELVFFESGHSLPQEWVTVAAARLDDASTSQRPRQ